jgi:hypothetical protein
MLIDLLDILRNVGYVAQTRADAGHPLAATDVGPPREYLSSPEAARASRNTRFASSIRKANAPWRAARRVRAPAVVIRGCDPSREPNAPDGGGCRDPQGETVHQLRAPERILASVDAVSASGLVKRGERPMTVEKPSFYPL